MTTLVPCPTCRRHVHATEAHCPFCARSGRHVVTSALVATTLAVGLAVSACGGGAGGPGPEAGGGAVALYGGPPVEPTEQPSPGADEPGEGDPAAKEPGETAPSETEPGDPNGGGGGPVAAYGPPPK
ncbi:MAG: hypothetical protein IT376_18495 [Polyangiaceae bacterium]|nr:hypothetical protein [Polyangiaceae bacterium]